MMFSKETEALLHKSLPTLPRMVCNRSLKHDIDDLAAMALPVRTLAVIDDLATAQAFGDAVFRALKGRFDCIHITLEGSHAADKETVEELRRKTTRCDALVAAGSGTISDLCKYASFSDGKPYIVFPTAASMNGYLSANASISVDGYKKTFAAHMPQAVFCDMSVIAAAPVRLSKSGLGDSLARSTAQADWLLSHLLLGTAYDETPFELLKQLEPHLHDSARGIAKGDLPSIELLMQTLLLSGLGMTIAHGSYPASQGEHMIAHCYEMLVASGKWQVTSKEKSNLAILHGEQIGVTTLTMALMQENILKSPPPLPVRHSLSDGGWGRLREGGDFKETDIVRLFGSKIAEEAKKSYRIKQELMEKANPDASIRWHDIMEQISQIIIPSARIHAILKAAECPDTPEALGWDAKNYEIAISYARFMRDRVTFLDLDKN